MSHFKTFFFSLLLFGSSASAYIGNYVLLEKDGKRVLLFGNLCFLQEDDGGLTQVKPERDENDATLLLKYLVPLCNKCNSTWILHTCKKFSNVEPLIFSQLRGGLSDMGVAYDVCDHDDDDYAYGHIVTNFLHFHDENNAEHGEEDREYEKCEEHEVLKQPHFGALFSDTLFVAFYKNWVAQYESYLSSSLAAYPWRGLLEKASESVNTLFNSCDNSMVLRDALEQLVAKGVIERERFAEKLLALRNWHHAAKLTDSIHDDKSNVVVACVQYSSVQGIVMMLEVLGYTRVKSSRHLASVHDAENRIWKPLAFANVSCEGEMSPSFDKLCDALADGGWPASWHSFMVLESLNILSSGATVANHTDTEETSSSSAGTFSQDHAEESSTS